MIKTNCAVYLGEKEEQKTLVYYYSQNFFAVLRVEKEEMSEAAKAMLEELAAAVERGEVTSLYQLEEGVNQMVEEKNLPIGFDLAIVVLKERVAYLKTRGEGIVLLKRGRRLGEIIRGENSASGFVEEGDYIILGFTNFEEKIDKEALNQLIDKKEPHLLVEDLAIKLKESGDSGLLLLMVKFSFSTGEKKVFFQRKISLPKIELPKNIFFQIINFYKKLETRKKAAFLLSLIFFSFFIFRTTQGFIKMLTDEKIKKIKLVEEEINKRLTEAEDMAFFNFSQAIEEINISKRKIDELKKEMGKSHAKEIEGLEKLVLQKEREILKKEERKYEEFYDLAIENKEATGERSYLSGNILLILDNKNGRIYQLNLEKKSIESYGDKKIKEAKLVVYNAGKIFYLVEKEGVYLIENEKSKKVIDNNKEWGKIIDFWEYYGNLYLLDRENDEIYKYLPVEGGYSKKTSYFQVGQAIDLEEVNSMAIDGSIYLGFSDYILKYTSGVKESFKANLPQKAKIDKIYTNKNLEKLFGWSKEEGIIFVFSKDGNYERQIYSSILKKASDMVVFKDKIFILWQNKIYTINL